MYKNYICRVIIDQFLLGRKTNLMTSTLIQITEYLRPVLVLSTNSNWHYYITLWCFLTVFLSENKLSHCSLPSHPCYQGRPPLLLHSIKETALGRSQLRRNLCGAIMQRSGVKCLPSKASHWNSFRFETRELNIFTNYKQ